MCFPASNIKFACQNPSNLEEKTVPNCHFYPQTASEKSFEDYHQKSNIFYGNRLSKIHIPTASNCNSSKTLQARSFIKDDFRDTWVVKLTCNWKVVASDWCRFFRFLQFSNRKNGLSLWKKIIGGQRKSINCILSPLAGEKSCDSMKQTLSKVLTNFIV